MCNVKLIYFGIDTDKFSFQERIILKNRTIKLLSIRNLEEIYNIECIIEMIEIISNEGLDVKLSIYSDGSLSKKLKKLVSDKLLDDKISFHGKYYQENLPNILSEHDIYISMARSDAGIASSTAEAMSTGMICLISNVSENNLWISHNSSGLLIKDNDPEDLAKHIKLIISGKINFKDFGIKAREKIITSNSINQEMIKMCKIYQTIEDGLE
jgi:glycosyltransferase involved in cell wall biosynthesis